MLGFMVVVADLGTALVPVITAVIVFWIAGLEGKYMLRVGLIAMALVVVAIASRGYRLGRIIAYVDPDYSKIETIDPGGRLKAYMQRSTSVRDASYQPRPIADRCGNRRRVRHGIDAGQTEADVPARRAHRFHFCHGRRRTGLYGDRRR
jgi:cell division protein FtsW